MLDMLSTLDIEIVIIIGVKMALRKHGHVINCDFSLLKNDNFQLKKMIIFIFLLKHRGYTLEPPH